MAINLFMSVPVNSEIQDAPRNAAAPVKGAGEGFDGLIEDCLKCAGQINADGGDGETLSKAGISVTGSNANPGAGLVSGGGAKGIFLAKAHASKNAQEALSAAALAASAKDEASAQAAGPTPESGMNEDARQEAARPVEFVFHGHGFHIKSKAGKTACPALEKNVEQSKTEEAVSSNKAADTQSVFPPAMVSNEKTEALDKTEQEDDTSGSTGISAVPSTANPVDTDQVHVQMQIPADRHAGLHTDNQDTGSKPAENVVSLTVDGKNSGNNDSNAAFYMTGADQAVDASQAAAVPVKRDEEAYTTLSAEGAINNAAIPAKENRTAEAHATEKQAQSSATGAVSADANGDAASLEADEPVSTVSSAAQATENRTAEAHATEKQAQSSATGAVSVDTNGDTASPEADEPVATVSSQPAVPAETKTDARKAPSLKSARTETGAKAVGKAVDGSADRSSSAADVDEISDTDYQAAVSNDSAQNAIKSDSGMPLFTNHARVENFRGESVQGVNAVNASSEQAAVVSDATIGNDAGFASADTSKDGGDGVDQGNAPATQAKEFGFTLQSAQADKTQTQSATTVADQKAAQAIDAADLRSKVEDGVRISVAGNGKEVKIKLHPENLGEMQIRINMTDASARKVTAEILVDNQAVRDALSADLGSIKEALGKQGLVLDKCSVELGGSGFAGSDNGQGQGGSQGQEALRENLYRNGARAFYQPESDNEASAQAPIAAGPNRSYTQGPKTGVDLFI